MTTPRTPDKVCPPKTIVLYLVSIRISLVQTVDKFLLTVREAFSNPNNDFSVFCRVSLIVEKRFSGSRIFLLVCYLETLNKVTIFLGSIVLTDSKVSVNHFSSVKCFWANLWLLLLLSRCLSLCLTRHLKTMGWQGRRYLVITDISYLGLFWVWEHLPSSM